MDFEHRSEESRFVTTVEGGEAELSYRRIDGSTLDFEHTYVPPALRGAGVAGKLVTEALEFARNEGYRVRPSCPFVASFLEKHPEYRDVEEAKE